MIKINLSPTKFNALFNLSYKTLLDSRYCKSYLGKVCLLDSTFDGCPVPNLANHVMI